MAGHPVFAAFYDLMTKGFEAKLLGPIRHSLLQSVTGNVLDVGAGTGANLPYFPHGARVIALEPDPHMRNRGRIRSARTPVKAEARWMAGSAESLPFADGLFDAVVATLVFCTVQDPASALREVRRVLKKRGRFVFIEHVVSEHAGWNRLQSLLSPVWKRVGAGCHLDRDTLSAIGRAGFEVMRVESQTPMGLVPIIYGYAVK